MSAVALAAAVVFAAELGDKSQLLTLAFAARHKAVPTLVAITIAVALVTGLSAAAGAALGDALPRHWVNIGAGVAFLAFAAWGATRRDDDGDEPTEPSTASTLVTVGVAFFLGELGDKTMVATVSLASAHPPGQIWLGSTIGMVGADALAIVAGRTLGRRLPRRAIERVSTVLFVVYGMVLLAEGLSRS